jgi:hypothetical protein
MHTLLTEQSLGARLASIVDLQAAINRYLKEHNDDPKPFVWTKSADANPHQAQPIACTFRLSQCTSFRDIVAPRDVPLQR